MSWWHLDPPPARLHFEAAEPWIQGNTTNMAARKKTKKKATKKKATRKAKRK